jgi:hypothetical protein
MRIQFNLCSLAIVIYSTVSFSQVSQMGKPLFNSPYVADTLFRGAGFFAKDTSKAITISIMASSLWNALGRLYLMDPEQRDAKTFLFHNHPVIFPGESTTVNIGAFHKGKQIILMFEFCDTVAYRGFLGDRLYSGQNRDSIDDYISDVTSLYKDRQLSMAGRIDSTTVEVGFNDARNGGYDNAILRITNIFLEGLEKSKVPRPRMTPMGGSFQSKVSVSLDIKSEGLYSIIKRKTHIDTLAPLNHGAVLKYYYTTDSTDPRSSSTRKVYSTPLELSQTTVLKAYAVFESDTNWFPSEVATAVFTKEQTPVLGGLRPGNSQSGTSEFRIYTMNGRLVHSIIASEQGVAGYMDNLRSGVYLVRSSVSPQIKRVAIGKR